MGNAGSVVVDFVADMERFSPRVKDAPKQVRDSAAKINQELDKIGGGEKGGLRRLREMFGGGSEFGLLTTTLAGGGALVGLSMVGNVVGTLGARLSEAAKNGTSLAEAFVESLPVVGSLYTGFSKLADGIHAALGEETVDQARALAAALEAIRVPLGGMSDLAKQLAAPELEIIRAAIRQREQLLATPKPGMGEVTTYGQMAMQNELEGLRGQLRQRIAEIETTAAEKQAAKAADDHRKALDAILGAMDKESNALLFSRDALLIERMAQAGASAETIRAAMLKRQLADATKSAADRAREAAAAIEAEDAAQRKRTAGMLSAVGKEVGEYGLTPRQKQAREVFFSGAGFYEKAGALGQVSLLGAMDKRATAMERAKFITESMRTPAERYADTMKELNGILATSADFQDTYARAAAAARKELEGEGLAAGAIGGFEGIADTWRRIAGTAMRQTGSASGASESTAKTTAKHTSDAVAELKGIRQALAAGVVAVLGV